MVRLVPGLGNSQIIRPGYAIEYDFVDPRELGPDLQTRRFRGLYHAGQINGTTGYEEAACQGLIAGINAALSTQGRKSFRIRRDQAYIGVLIDDLISQGVDEPYRVFTSRAENRLMLRFDNADARLRPLGRELGLVGDGDWNRYNARRDRIGKLRRVIGETRIRRSDSAYAAASLAVGSDLGDSISLEQLSKRACVGADLIASLLPQPVESLKLRTFRPFWLTYSTKATLRITRPKPSRLYHHDSLRIPEEFNFRGLGGLSSEMVERLERAQPGTFGDARRVAGMTSAGLTALLVNLTVVNSTALSRVSRETLRVLFHVKLLPASSAQKTAFSAGLDS